jgi:hypothetical protein
LLMDSNGSHGNLVSPFVETHKYNQSSNNISD